MKICAIVAILNVMLNFQSVMSVENGINRVKKTKSLLDIIYEQAQYSCSAATYLTPSIPETQRRHASDTDISTQTFHLNHL